jgi:hypothetical protein
MQHENWRYGIGLGQDSVLGKDGQRHISGQAGFASDGVERASMLLAAFSGGVSPITTIGRFYDKETP